MKLKQHSGLITTVWVLLNFLPLFIVVGLCLVIQSWAWSAFFVLLYLLIIVPYGFFVSLPMMVKIFHKPASLHRR
ncbi:MAG: hypothetical protein AB7G75_33165 [Candidatus Binatia bacterium]